MLSSIPFSITPDAEDYLRNRLKKAPPEVQPVLMMATSQNDGLNPPRWSYEGQSFIIGYLNVIEKPKIEYTESEIFGRRVAIELNASKQLAGRTLNLRRVYSRYGLMTNTRFVLIADSAPESPISAFEGQLLINSLWGVTRQTPLRASKIQIMPSVSCSQYKSRERLTHFRSDSLTSVKVTRRNSRLAMSPT